MSALKKTENFDDYVPTLNRMGYMSPSLDKIQTAFVDYCKTTPEGLFLDIGCGFGVGTIPVVKENRHIIACDLEKRHLEVLKSRIPADKLPFLTLMSGHFPDEIDFPENSFDGINYSMVIHFLPAHTLEKAIQKVFSLLKPGGRLFLTTSSPYQGVLTPFIPLYEERKGREEWPGFIPDVSLYVPHRAGELRKESIVFCPEELSRLVRRFTFRVLETSGFSREGIPKDLSLEGQEYSGVICEKPRE